jgi:hypothetical protein
MLRAAIGRAGLVEAWLHRCRAPGCGHEARSQKATPPERCPRCGKPTVWAKPIPRHVTFHGTRHSWEARRTKDGKAVPIPIAAPLRPHVEAALRSPGELLFPRRDGSMRAPDHEDAGLEIHVLLPESEDLALAQTRVN